MEPVIGFALCGSFCTFSRVLDVLERLKTQYPNIIPILSEASYTTDTRFGAAADFRTRIEAICGHEILHTIAQTEPIGPKKLLDCLVIAPCTGNTLAKLACGIADSPVTLAAKAHLRNERPIVLAVSTNDALAGNAPSIGTLLTRRHYYFVPFSQDNAAKKPRSMVAHFELLPETIAAFCCFKCRIPCRSRKRCYNRFAVHHLDQLRACFCHNGLTVFQNAALCQTWK